MLNKSCVLSFQGALVWLRTWVTGQWRIRTAPSSHNWRNSSRLSTKPESRWACAASPPSSLPKSCPAASSLWDRTKSVKSLWNSLSPSDVRGYEEKIYSSNFPPLFVSRWPYAQTAGAVKEMGCKHVNTDVDKAHVDVKNKLVTTCAFMCNAPFHKVFDGIGVMVEETLKLA